MFSRLWAHTLVEILLVALTSVTAFAQYGGGSGGTTSGSSSGTYTAPSGGYSSGATIGIVAGAVAGVVIAYLLLHNRGTLVGCVEKSSNGMKLMNEKDKRTYALESGASPLKVGDRMALKGKKSKSKSGAPEFAVTKIAKDYGPCDKTSTANARP